MMGSNPCNDETCLRHAGQVAGLIWVTVIKYNSLLMFG